MIEGQEQYRKHRTFEIFGLVAFAVLAVWVTIRTVTGVLATSWGWVALLVGGFVGYLLADLLSGMIHWIFDRFGSVNTPVFGSNFIRPFREHHSDPLDITLHDFTETNGNSAIGAVIPLALASFLPNTGIGWVFALAVILVLCWATLATNQIHKWAHSKNAPRLVRRLQRAQIILSPEHHQIHHTAPFDTYYCITTGWMNRPLAKMKFHATAERVLNRQPNRSD